MVNTVAENPGINGQALKTKVNNFKSIIRDTNADKLEVKDIINAVKQAIVDVTELEITTWVPDSSTQDEPQNFIEKAKPGNRIHTVIRLIDGDITNEVGSQFVGNGPYTELREFHLTQIKESREIMHKNIESIHKLYEILMELFKSLKSSQQPNNRL